MSPLSGVRPFLGRRKAWAGERGVRVWCVHVGLCSFTLPARISTEAPAAGEYDPRPTSRAQRYVFSKIKAQLPTDIQDSLQRINTDPAPGQPCANPRVSMSSIAVPVCHDLCGQASQCPLVIQEGCFNDRKWLA